MREVAEAALGSTRLVEKPFFAELQSNQMLCKSLVRGVLRGALEAARAPSLAQLAQRLRLDLANTFARDGEQFADLFERAVGLLADSEAHPQDLLFAWRLSRQHLARQPA